MIVAPAVRYKRLCLQTSGLLLALSAAIPQAHASVYGGQSLKSGLDFVKGQLTGSGINTSTNLRELIIDVLAIVLNYVTLFAVISIIIAGIYLIVSNGDEANKDKAKKMILYTCIGLVVILLSRLIVAFVNSLF